MHGAAGEVTGSSYLVETGRSKVLIDFGMFQGVRMAETRNRIPRGLSVANLDAVLLTHAHLDHCGRLPLLVRRGFGRPIFATPATIDLVGLILRDAAKIQLHDNHRINRKRERAGQEPIEPLFNAEDVEKVMGCCRPVPYKDVMRVTEDIEARFVEAGHILGSSSIQLLVKEEGRVKKVVFSGDLGPHGLPILRDYVPFKEADLVFMESTYGNRDHRSHEKTIEEFREIVSRVVERKGKILVPTFAVGRAQHILYYLALMFREKVVKPFPVFVDSPMAVEASRIYLQHPELYDEELNELRKDHSLLQDLISVKPSISADESRALNDLSGPCLIMAGAGMCNAGRILHHFKQNLWKSSTEVMIVGYQAEGSLGRLLLEGRSQVKIFGERIAVNAKIHSLGGFSAHAGQTDLIAWFSELAEARPRLVLTHGEDRGRKPLSHLIEEKFGVTAELPGYGDVIEC